MKIYLAGGESGDAKPPIETGKIDNILLSYYYIRKKGSFYLPLIRKKCRKIFVDSGAHSFFAETPGIDSASSVKKKTKTKQLPEDYFQKYKIWVKENYHLMDYYVELDIGEIVGQDVVNRWREELKELNIYDKCVTVYHPKVMSEKDFIDMLDESESRYVGLEGLRENKSNLPYKKLIKLCYDRNVRVHGFAMIRDVWLDSVPFTSVDSVSWKAGAMYGTAMVKKPKGKITAVRLKSKHQMVKNGLSLMEYHKQTKEEQRFLLAMTAIESYKEKEKYFTDLWNKRGISWDE